MDGRGYGTCDCGSGAGASGIPDAERGGDAGVHGSIILTVINKMIPGVLPFGVSIELNMITRFGLYSDWKSVRQNNFRPTA
jgi:hypothetical protein